MYALISNYGDDSIALMQWAKHQQLADVTVIYVETGWAGPSWAKRVAQGVVYGKKSGFHIAHLRPSLQFAELMLDRKAFPSQKFQWCAAILKGLPIVMALDEMDASCMATVMLATRKQAARAYALTPAVIEDSAHFGGRKVCHPLLDIDTSQRDTLVHEAGFAVLGHRSLECDLCVNSGLADFKRASKQTVEKVHQLEQQVGKPMFTPAGEQQPRPIHEVIALAKKQDGAAADKQPHSVLDMGCGSPYGCGL